MHIEVLERILYRRAVELEGPRWKNGKGLIKGNDVGMKED